ncbi:MAG: copper resistance protein NlpE [Prevotellaceae bacterium]|jgi:uncharacterized lipoprotein NlpE involved in copper resistance|nr:copper resistance protein NlpE [Prevotellaceae bacterium]
MKKILLVIGVAALLLACGQKKQVEVAGVYNGVLPCADCEGIKTMLELQADSSYILETQYLGKSEEINNYVGKFTLNEDVLVLDNAKYNGFNTQYLVGDSTLTQLDAEGNVIAGEFAAMYVLRK